MISAEWVTAVGTVVMAIAVGVYAYLVYKQTKSFQEQTEKMEEYIETMKESIKQEKIKRKRDDMVHFLRNLLNPIIEDLESKKEDIKDIKKNIFHVTFSSVNLDNYKDLYQVLEEKDPKLSKEVKDYYKNNSKYTKLYNEI